MSAHTALGLDVGHLRVSFDGFVAVADTSFCVAPGESFGIVGESGSGKSTVLRAICGLAPKESGTAERTGDGDKAVKADAQVAHVQTHRRVRAHSAHSGRRSSVASGCVDAPNCGKHAISPRVYGCCA